MTASRATGMTIVIPTRNRSRSLLRTVDALQRQTALPSVCEIIIVLDGCTDDTLRSMEHFRSTLPLVKLAVTPEHRGPAFARNLGARAATGDIILFLDDDVVPEAHLVQAHLQAHESSPAAAVIGPYFPIPQPKADGFRVMQQSWWNDKFVAMRQYGHRFSYTDVLSGNLSLRSRDFHRLGGFDESLPAAHEDYELGMRIMKAGLSIVFAATATAWHHEHEHMTVQQSFRRARMEGRADLIIARRYSILVRALPFAMLQRESALPYRMVRTLAYSHSWLGNRLAPMLTYLLSLLDRFRFRYAFLKLYKAVRYYWYLRGVVEQAGDSHAVADVLRSESGEVPKGAEIDLDLRHGLALAETRLDQDRPMSVRIKYGSQIIGTLPFQPGAEPLRGSHLRKGLTTTLAWPYLMALVMDQAKQQKAHPQTAVLH